MEINVTQEQGRVPVTVLHLIGDLDGSSYEQLAECARQVMGEGAGYLLLNMAKVPYMSSAGIRVIHQIFNALRSLPDGEDEAALKTTLVNDSYKSRRLKLLKPSAQVVKALATAGIDMYVEMHEDMKKAIASY